MTTQPNYRALWRTSARPWPEWFLSLFPERANEPYGGELEDITLEQIVAESRRIQREEQRR
jgi:hypothetical protein